MWMTASVGPLTPIEASILTLLNPSAAFGAKNKKLRTCVGLPDTSLD